MLSTSDPLLLPRVDTLELKTPFCINTVMLSNFDNKKAALGN